ncbi:HWE histidine kinase domain-containing protein [Tabrizicola sp.]|uniref:HWE histidine kinase domain-containing protein n=1 Tax=Tabrizicola sp. TaxID=2005166 RepID=UPI002FDC8F02
MVRSISTVPGMADLIARFDWAATPLGPRESWPQSLRTAVDILQNSGHAMQLAWGPKRTILYNDAYAPMLGARHPTALGQPFDVAWPEIWPEIQPLVDKVFEGNTIRNVEFPLVMTRNGYPEETWWNFSYSPVRDETGAVRGLLNVTVDATAKVRAERAERALHESEERQAFLLRLGDELRPLADAAMLRARGCELLGKRLNVARVYHLEYDPAQGVGVIADDFRTGGLPSLAGRYPFKALRTTYEHVAGGATWIMPDMTADESLAASEREVFLTQGAMSWVDVPLLKDGKLAGALCVVDDRPRVWTPQETRLVEDTAERLWALMQRARAEAALRESEIRFRQFGASSLAAIWIRDARSFAFEYVNDTVERVFGLTPQQLAADERVLGALIVPEERDDMSQRVLRIARGETLISEYRIRRASDQSFRWIRSIGFPIHDTRGEVVRIGGIAEDITETKLAREHQQVLVSELQHRVRNLMTVIRTIAARTVRGAATPEDYRNSLDGRLTALARVQMLLTRSASRGAPLREVIEAELRAKAEDDSRFDLSGPEVQLSPKVVEVLALAFHELCTNAMKYGALSVPGGVIRVRWRRMDREGFPWLELAWVETGAPLTSPPARHGFGSELIERRIPYELGGRGVLSFAPGGATCHLEFPLQDHESVLDTEAPPLAAVFGGVLDMANKLDLGNRKVLVVEDDFYIAADLAASLRDAKAMVLGPYPSEAEALEAVGLEAPEAAVLDINLGDGGPRFDLARQLRRRGIPFVFLTGYSSEVIPEDLSDVPLIEKPTDFHSLIDLLATF